MPPKIRKICEALSTIWEFSDAMENYLDEKGTYKLINVLLSSTYFFYFSYVLKEKVLWHIWFHWDFVDLS